MNCDNNFCVYWEKDKCTLDKISVDNFGLCADCIFVILKEKTLRHARRKILKSYEDDYKKWDARLLSTND